MEKVFLNFLQKPFDEESVNPYYPQTLHDTKLIQKQACEKTFHEFFLKFMISENEFKHSGEAIFENLIIKSFDAFEHQDEMRKEPVQLPSLP